MKKKILGLFSVMLISLLVVTNVHALEITQAGADVVSEGDYSSARLLAGNNVVDRSNVDGLSFVAGNEVILEGSSEYGFYAGNTVTINENITKDLFVAGNSINIGSDAIIGRDAYIAGNAIKISTNVGRDLRVGGMSVNLSGITINGDAYIDAEVITMNEDTVITGKLIYLENATVTGLDAATIGEVETRPYDEVVIEYNFMDDVYSFIISAVAAFIVLIVLFYLIPRTKEKLDNVKLDPSTVFITAAIGIAVLFVTPIISIFAMFTGFLTPLALILFAVYIIAIYLSNLLTYYVVGNVVTTKVFKKDNVYIALVCGIVLVKLIKLIPVIGGFIGFIALIYGLGLVFNFIKSRGN